MYDYGARNYDAAIGRWMNMDPLAEKRYKITPFNFVQNSPMYRIDPDGMTDYTLNRKTGEIKQVGEVNDEPDKPDRILKTRRNGKVKYDRKGKAKVAIGNIDKGILKNGMNLKEKDILIDVGGQGKPTVDGVKSFTLKLSEYIGKEIKGFSYSSDASNNVTDMVLGKYKYNLRTSSQGTVRELQNKYGANFSLNNVLEQFHTHPDGTLGATEEAPELSQDVTALQNDKNFIPNARFIVLYRDEDNIRPAEYDYTPHYRPRKK